MICEGEDGENAQSRKGPQKTSLDGEISDQIPDEKKDRHRADNPGLKQDDERDQMRRFKRDG